MTVNIVEEVCKSVMRALRNETLLETSTTDNTEPAAAPQEGHAVASLLNQLTEQVIVEITKILIARSRRLSPEEATGSAEKVIKDLTKEVLKKSVESIDAPSTGEVGRKLHDVRVLLHDAEALLRAKKSSQAIACIAQCRHIIG